MSSPVAASSPTFSTSTSNSNNTASNSTPATSAPTSSATSAPMDGKVMNYWNVKSLNELFAKLGLQNYSALFIEQEVDLSTFLTLCEDDLKELGVKTFGARRKMILAIQSLTEMRAQNANFLSNVYNYALTENNSPIVSPANSLSSSSGSLTGVRSSSDYLSQSLSASFQRRTGWPASHPPSDI